MLHLGENKTNTGTCITAVDVSRSSSFAQRPAALEERRRAEVDLGTVESEGMHLAVAPLDHLTSHDAIALRRSSMRHELER